MQTKTVTESSPYKVNEGICSLLVEVHLSQLSKLGKNGLELFVRDVPRKVPHKEAAAGIKFLLCDIKRRKVKLWPTEFRVYSLFDLILQWGQKSLLVGLAS